MRAQAPADQGHPGFPPAYPSQPGFPPLAYPGQAPHPGYPAPPGYPGQAPHPGYPAPPGYPAHPGPGGYPDQGGYLGPGGPPQAGNRMAPPGYPSPAYPGQAPPPGFPGQPGYLGPGGPGQPGYLGPGGPGQRGGPGEQSGYAPAYPGQGAQPGYPGQPTPRHPQPPGAAEQTTLDIGLAGPGRPQLQRIPGASQDAGKRNALATTSLFTWVIPLVGLIVGVAGIVVARRSGIGIKRAIAGTLLAVAVLAGVGVYIPRVLKAADPGCGYFKTTALPAYNQMINDVDHKKLSSALGPEIQSVAGQLATASGKTSNASVTSALHALITQLATVKTATAHGTLPASVTTKLNAAATSLDNACGSS
jgi:hypothetical protein